MSDSILRVLTDEPASGAWNMAVDEALLDGVVTGGSPATLRFYRWRPACLSLGYFQSWDVVDDLACRRRGVEIVRRPTGGRAILHDRELTYSVALPLSLFSGDQGVVASYSRLSRALVAGLRAAGYPVSAEADPVDHRQDRGPACFERPAQHEILLDGRKVVGSAQVRRGSALLQHGSILFAPQIEETLRLLRLTQPERTRLRSRMTAGVGGLETVRLDQPVRLAAILAESMAGGLGLRAVAGSLTVAERRQADKKRQGPDEEGHCSGDGRTAAESGPCRLAARVRP